MPREKVSCFSFLRQLFQRADYRLGIPDHRVPFTDRLKIDLCARRTLEPSRQLIAAPKEPIRIVETHVQDRLEITHNPASDRAMASAVLGARCIGIRRPS